MTGLLLSSTATATPCSKSSLRRELLSLLGRKDLIAEWLVGRRSNGDEGAFHRLVAGVAAAGQFAIGLDKALAIFGCDRIGDRLQRRLKRRHVGHGNAGIEHRGLDQARLELVKFESSELPVRGLAGVPQLDVARLRRIHDVAELGNVLLFRRWPGL